MWWSKQKQEQASVDVTGWRTEVTHSDEQGMHYRVISPEGHSVSWEGDIKTDKKDPSCVSKRGTREGVESEMREDIRIVATRYNAKRGLADLKGIQL